MTTQESRSRRDFLRQTGATTVALGSIGATTGIAAGQQADSITYYNAGGLESDPGTEENINRFEEETGITVNVNEVPWANLKTTLTTQWRNQSAAIDAFNGPTWWLSDFVAAEYVAPLNLGQQHMSKFPENLRSLVTFDGNVYMAPQLGKWTTFLYDQQYLNDQNVQNPPQNWQETIEIGEQLTNQNRSGFAFTWANKDVFTFKQFLYQAGGQMFNENDEPVFAGEAGQAVFDDLVVPLRERDVLPDGIQSMGEGPVGDAFIAGQFGMVESWTPLGPRALGSQGWNPDRLGVTTPPEGPASAATFQDTNGVSVSAFSEKQGAAREFARFMSTTESCKTDMIVEGNPAPIPAVYDDQDVRDAYPGDWLDAQRQNLENAQSETYLAQPRVDEILSNQITPALLGQTEPAQALQTAQQQIRQLYQRVGVL